MPSMMVTRSAWPRLDLTFIARSFQTTCAHTGRRRRDDPTAFGDGVGSGLDEVSIGRALVF